MSEPVKPDESSVGNTIWSILVVVGMGFGIYSKFKGPAAPPKSEPQRAASVSPVSETATTFRPDPSHTNPAIPRYSNPHPSHEAQPQQQLSDQQAAQLQFLIQAAALQQQAQQFQQSQQSEQHQRFNQAAAQARVCFNCGGAGSYRFVDSYGNLNARQCPKCMGTGKSW
ncbi:MAG: Membrane protein [Planctomycetaceae bacterium]|nr:Membrane protein [Planctomycetaceae bacterium]